MDKLKAIHQNKRWKTAIQDILSIQKQMPVLPYHPKQSGFIYDEQTLQAVKIGDRIYPNDLPE
jgi:hypothetical protein